MKMDLSDPDDWVRVGHRGPDREGRMKHFTTSKLRMSKNARRGRGSSVHVPDNAPKFVFCMGYTQKKGIGVDSRTNQRNNLRSQANYHNLDGKLGQAFSFDKNGEINRVWGRVEEWEDDWRYFRASLNPLDHEAIKDWPRFLNEFMDTLQHGSQRAFGMEGEAMHWHADGILTDDDRAKGHGLDWVASLHRETGRTHAHVLIRGKVGMDDLYIEPGATKQFWKIGRGVASMDHHVGMKLELSQDMEQADAKAVQAIEREAELENVAVRRFTQELEL